MTKRILIIAFILVSLALAASTVYYYLQYLSSVKELARLRVVEEVNSPLEGQVVQQQMIIDSLDQEIAALQKEVIDTSIQIQLGMFQSFDLSIFEEQYHSIHQEEVDGLHVILMRGFRSIDSAELALQKLKTLGFKGAFIVEPESFTTAEAHESNHRNEATF